MECRTSTPVVVTLMLAAVALALPIAANAQQREYKIIDVGTLGGPSAHGPGNGSGSQLLNDAGIVVATADTLTPDPAAPICQYPDCLLTHAFRWQDGILADLGAFPGSNNSQAHAINANGWIAGISTNGKTDAFNPACGFQPLCPQFRAVLWRDGKLIDVGTLGEGLESDSLYVNNAGLEKWRER